MANSIFEKIGHFLGTDKADQSTGATTAENTEHAFKDDLIDLGNMVAGSTMGKELLSKLDGIKSFNPEQIQSILGALSQSTDSKVESAKQDLQASQHDGEAFVTKLKGYISTISQMLPTILPALQSILGKK